MEEAHKCKDCGIAMVEVGNTGTFEELGEYRNQENSDMPIWHKTGVRSKKLYQCPEDKTIAIN